MAEFDPKEFHDLLFGAYDAERGIVLAKGFIDGIEVVPRLFDVLGGILKAGNSALTDKISIVKQRMDESIEDLGISRDEISLQDIINRDILNKWTHTGKKKRHATRNIIRLVWFLDFVVALFTKIVDQSVTTTRDVLLSCWKETLGPRQRRMVNMSTTAALKIATPPTHERLFEIFKVDGLNVEERREAFLEWAENINRVAECLWTYFKENKIEKVP